MKKIWLLLFILLSEKALAAGCGASLQLVSTLRSVSSNEKQWDVVRPDYDARNYDRAWSEHGEPELFGDPESRRVFALLETVRVTESPGDYPDQMGNWGSKFHSVPSFGLHGVTETGFTYFVAPLRRPEWVLSLSPNELILGVNTGYDTRLDVYIRGEDGRFPAKPSYDLTLTGTGWSTPEQDGPDTLWFWNKDEKEGANVLWIQKQVEMGAAPSVAIQKVRDLRSQLVRKDFVLAGETATSVYGIYRYYRDVIDVTRLGLNGDTKTVSIPRKRVIPTKTEWGLTVPGREFALGDVKHARVNQDGTRMLLLDPDNGVVVVDLSAPDQWVPSDLRLSIDDTRNLQLLGDSSVVTLQARSGVRSWKLR